MPNTRTLLLFTLVLPLMSALTVTTAVADSHEAKGVVLITGANRGLGLEFATQYAADGWQVIGTARKPGDADALEATGAKVLQLDVTDADSIAALAAALDGTAIDLLINNAGIFPRESKLENVDFDDYAAMLAVNTIGPARVTQALLPNLRAGDGKKIVNITSRLGSIEYNSGGFYGYRESKAALNMFTKTLAAELGGEGFICLAIHPGWVATDMGGPNATLTPPQSVAGMREVIGSLSDADNGSYRSYAGDAVPW